MILKALMWTSQRGLLIWLLLIWALHLVSAIRDKMLVVNKELTREGVKSKVAKCEFDS